MTTIAVVAHVEKSFGGGLPELREHLASAGFSEPLWVDVSKSKQVPSAVRQVVEKGADLVFVWGGDGTVQRAVDTLAGTSTALAVLPAGTGNLLARNLGVPLDVGKAVDIGLHGTRRTLDVGRINGEHFAIMAGAGFDALTMERADTKLKERIGRTAYLWHGARSLTDKPIKCRIRVGGRTLYKGKVTCVLVGNLSEVMGGLSLFPQSDPADGILEWGVVSARSRLDWMRAFGRVVTGHPEKSPFVVTSRAVSLKARFDEPVLYELDGSVRKPTRTLRIKVVPQSLVVCVPDDRIHGDG